jgi:hypothetical protein
MTLDYAQERFMSHPSPGTAGDYLARLMEYESDGMIGDDTFHNGLAVIRDYLQRFAPRKPDLPRGKPHHDNDNTRSIK